MHTKIAFHIFFSIAITSACGSKKAAPKLNTFAHPCHYSDFPPNRPRYYTKNLLARDPTVAGSHAFYYSQNGLVLSENIPVAIASEGLSCGEKYNSIRETMRTFLHRNTPPNIANSIEFCRISGGRPVKLSDLVGNGTLADHPVCQLSPAAFPLFFMSLELWYRGGAAKDHPFVGLLDLAQSDIGKFPPRAR